MLFLEPATKSRRKKEKVDVLLLKEGRRVGEPMQKQFVSFRIYDCYEYLKKYLTLKKDIG